MSECQHLGVTGNGPGNAPDPYCRLYGVSLHHRRDLCPCDRHPDYVAPQPQIKRCPTCGARMEAQP